MSQVINTNALSLMAQNNLNKSQSTLSTAIQRLSSGLRINSAKDDAAGQAISNRFTANINGLTQASRNANDGISLAQTTEGALNEVNDNLQNIRRLVTQAKNGTNSASDTSSIQDEINQRLAEINRISEQTEFNGVKVLSGDVTKLTIQVGANDGQTIDIDLSKMDASTLGMEGFTVENGVDASKLTDVTNVDIAAGYSYDTSGITDAETTAPVTIASIAKDSATGKVYGIGSDGNGYKLTDNEDGSFDVDTGTPSLVKGTDDTVLNALDDVTGKEATKSVAADMDTNGITGTLQTDGEGNYYIKDADNNLTKATISSMGVVKDTGTAVSTEPATSDPLATVDAALAQVDQLRSGLGAVQNRFDSVINNLNSTVNNLSASRSRILDADFASEVSEMSRSNILQSAGTTVLAQANQVPQNVLSLLR